MSVASLPLSTDESQGKDSPNLPEKQERRRQRVCRPMCIRSALGSEEARGNP